MIWKWSGRAGICLERQGIQSIFPQENERAIGKAKREEIQTADLWQQTLFWFWTNKFSTTIPHFSTKISSWITKWLFKSIEASLKIWGGCQDRFVYGGNISDKLWKPPKNIKKDSRTFIAANLAQIMRCPCLSLS